MRDLLLLLGVVVLSACEATVGTTAAVEVPRDAANTCARHCWDIGLQLSAVAIMANNVGCVCQPRIGPPGPVASNYGAATSAGMATIVMQQAVAEQQAARDRRQGMH